MARRGKIVISGIATTGYNDEILAVPLTVVINDFYCRIVFGRLTLSRTSM